MVPSALIKAASRPYRAAGRFAWHFAHGKLRHDPIFANILAHGLIPDNARILDLGSGQGLLAAWLMEAREWHRRVSAQPAAEAASSWPVQWPAPPKPRSIHGIELTARDVARARIALQKHGSRIEFVKGDIRDAPYPQADVVIAFDVLHYVNAASQEAILRRARASLAPNGVLLLRVSDAGAGWGAAVDRAVDFTMNLARAGRVNRLTCRSEMEWLDLLDSLQFNVIRLPMGNRAHRANLLLIARPNGENGAVASAAKKKRLRRPGRARPTAP
jgi:SAM-dependent methyltransferase